MEEIITELSGNVLRVQLNRPSKKNAMTVAMYAALVEEGDRADQDDDVAVSWYTARAIPSRPVTIWRISQAILPDLAIAHRLDFSMRLFDSASRRLQPYTASLSEAGQNASAFRLCLRGEKYEISGAVYQPRARTRTGVKLHASETDWISTSCRVDSSR